MVVRKVQASRVGNRPLKQDIKFHMPIISNGEHGLRINDFFQLHAPFLRSLENHLVLRGNNSIDYANFHARMRILPNINSLIQMEEKVAGGTKLA
jgi:hypothetical protein